MTSDFFVDENTPLTKYRRAINFSKSHAQNIIDGPCTHMDITSWVSWASTADRGFWSEHYSQASEVCVSDPHNPGNYINVYEVPEEGKSYIRWLLKGELKDNFVE